MKIIIPTDFSANARKAVDFVYSNTKRDESDIELVHYLEEKNDKTSIMVKLEYLRIKQAETNMILELEYIIQTFAHKPNHQIRMGNLNEIVGKTDRESHSKMMVMGSKGETNDPHKLMGSMSETILRNAEIPVILVPSSYSSKKIKNVVIASVSPELNLSKELEILDDIKLDHPNITVLFIDTDNTGELVPHTPQVNGFKPRVAVKKHRSISEGIDRYLEKNPTDLLVLPNKNSSIVNYLLRKSIIKNGNGHGMTHSPLMIFPSVNSERLPVEFDYATDPN